VIVTLLAATYLGGSRGALGFGSSLLDPIRGVRMFVVITLFLWATKSVLNSTSAFRMAGVGAVLMLAYGFYAMFSAIYSVEPLLTLWKGFEVFSAVITVIAISAHLRKLSDIQWLLNVMFIALLFLTISALSGALITPEIAFRAVMEGGNPVVMGDEGSSGIPILRGVFPEINPAALSGIAAVITSVSLVLLLDGEKTSRLGIYAVIILAITAMYLAHSRTGIFALVAAVVAILVIKKYVTYAVLIGLPVTIFLAFTSLPKLISSYVYRGQTEEQFSSMSGRVEFWSHVLDKFSESPLTGYGYYASHRILFGTSGIDNTYFSVLLGVGLIGFALFIAALLVGFIRIFRARPRKASSDLYRTLWLQILSTAIILFIRSLTGTSFETFYHLLLVYLILHISIFALIRIPDIDEQSEDEASGNDTGQISSEPRILRRKKRLTQTL
jgi:O-antigen ligase